MIRFLRRRRLLREAADLEAEARQLRRSMLHRVAGTWGIGAALASVAALSVAEAHGGEWGNAARATRETLMRGDDAKAAELEARAKALREEARHPIAPDRPPW